MATTRPDSYAQKLRVTTDYCTTNQLEQPQWQDYSDPRGIRTAWSSSVIIGGREYRATLWRDYRYLEQSREEAAEVAYKAIVAGQNQAGQYSHGHAYGNTR